MRQKKKNNPDKSSNNSWWKPQSLEVYRKYFSFFLKYKLEVVAFFFVSVILAIVQGVQPYFYKLFIDALDRNQIILQLFIWYCVLRLVSVFVQVLHHYLGDTYLLRAARDARITVFRKVQELDFVYHVSKNTGSLISAFKRGDNAFFNLFFEINVEFVQLILQLIVTLFFLSQVDFIIAVVMLVCFILTLIFALIIIKKNMKKRRLFNQIDDEISGIIVDNMINFETVKMFAQEDNELQRLKQKFTIWLKRLWNFAYNYYLMDTVVGLLGQTAVILGMYIALVKMRQQSLVISDVIMIIGYTTAFYPKFYQLMRRIRHIAKADVDLRKYFAPLDLETEVKDPAHPKQLENPQGQIGFHHLSFVYQDKEQEALRDFNLTIRSGQSIALVGRSGAGKTTIIKLLMRFFDPEEGFITIDGVDIRHMDKSYLRSLMGIVPQEPILFNQSIAYNISYGKSGKVTADEIKAAAKMANLANFIEDLPDKYQTQVGERGIKLSGGQKQRLAIARMILVNPSIVIFDEATSQLDSESERMIQEGFKKATKNKTTIIIAHRLSTIQHVDKIVVMDEGKIVEVGSHRHLLSQEDSLYKNFWSLQMLDS